MNSNPSSDVQPHRDLQPKPRSTISSNWLSFWTFAILTASNVYFDDLRKPMERLEAFATGLVAVIFAIVAVREQLEQRIATLLDCLERQGVLSAADRAAVGIVPRKTVETPTMWGLLRLALIAFGVVAVLVALGFYFAG